MGRDPIRLRESFARPDMRPGGFAGYYPRFPAAIPESRAGWSRVTQPFATRFPPRRGAVRLACVRRAASVHPEPGSNSPSKHVGGGARPAGCNADRIHSVLLASLWFGKESQGSRLTLLTSVHHCYHTKWHSFTSPGGSIRLRRTSASQYPVLKVRAVRDARCRAARRYIATAGGARGRGSEPPRFLHNRVGRLPPRA